MPVELPTLDSMDLVPAYLATQYEEKEGKAVPKNPKLLADEDVTALKGATNTERDRADKAEKRQREMAKELSDLKREKEGKAAGISDETLEKWRTDAAAERKPLEDELAAVKEELSGYKLATPAQEAFVAAGGNPVKWPKVKVLLIDAQKRLQLNDKGNPVVFDNGVATPQTLAQFFGGPFMEEEPDWYIGTDASGGGATPSVRGGTKSTYDPVAAGKAKAAKQKSTAKTSENRAFR